MFISLSVICITLVVFCLISFSVVIFWKEKSTILSKYQEIFQKELMCQQAYERSLLELTEIKNENQTLRQDFLISQNQVVQLQERAEHLEQKHSAVQQSLQLSLNETNRLLQDKMENENSLRATLQALEIVDKYQVHISQIENERHRSYERIENELKRVIESHQSLNHTTTALKNALKRPHVRGKWGEMQLHNCVELSGMSEYSDVVFQNAITSEEGNRVIPDMTVRMPGGRLVIVDAKTPIDAFLNSVETDDEEIRSAELIRHGRHVKEHIKQLAQKDYSVHFSHSADFTIMFLPNESFLYAALEKEPDIIEFALQKKVLIATPPTFIGLLKVIRFGWEEQKMAENAKMISEIGKELHKRLVDFVETYVDVGRHIDKAKEEYEVGLKRLRSRVLVQVRKLENLGAKSSKSLPLPLPLVEAEYEDDMISPS